MVNTWRIISSHCCVNLCKRIALQRVFCCVVLMKFFKCIQKRGQVKVLCWMMLCHTPKNCLYFSRAKSKLRQLYNFFLIFERNVMSPSFSNYSNHIHRTKDGTVCSIVCDPVSRRDAGEGAPQPRSGTGPTLITSNKRKTLFWGIMNLWWVIWWPHGFLFW